MPFLAKFRDKESEIPKKLKKSVTTQIWVGVTKKYRPLHIDPSIFTFSRNHNTDPSI